MDPWLKSALAYIDMWIEFQMGLADQPGCAIADFFLEARIA
jgi:hypothetical protein